MQHPEKRRLCNVYRLGVRLHLHALNSAQGSTSEGARLADMPWQRWALVLVGLVVAGYIVFFTYNTIVEQRTTSGATKSVSTRNLCPQLLLQMCSQIENGAKAATVFGDMDPSILRQKLEACVKCTNGPVVRQRVEEARTIEEVLKRAR